MHNKWQSYRVGTTKQILAQLNCKLVTQPITIFFYSDCKTSIIFLCIAKYLSHTLLDTGQYFTSHAVFFITA